MSKQGDHHYVPQFHLRMWENGCGKISQWGRIPSNNKLVCKLVTSAATAYERGLYSLEYVCDEEVQKLEIKFGEIETATKPVLEKLINLGPGRLSVQEKYRWAIYLNASLLRVPHVVKMVKSGMQERIAKDLSQPIPEFIAVKGDAPEDTLYKWALKHAPARVANSGLKVLVDLIHSEKVIDRIIRLQWLVRDLTIAPCRLLLSDNPFHRVGNLYEQRTLISIPLSPTHIFLASDAIDIVQHFDRMPAMDVVKASNQSTLRSAKRFVYGDAERDFVERYLFRH